MNGKLHRFNAVDFPSAVTMRHNTYRHHDIRASGFTLIELIACIVIIGILAAVIGPKFFDNTPFSQRGYVDELASAIRYANSVAVGSGCDVSITLTSTSYQALQRAKSGNTCAATGGWSTTVKWSDGSGNVAGAAPSNVTLSPAMQIAFNAQGNIIGGASPVLTIGTHTISVDAVSGLVTVQ